MAAGDTLQGRRIPIVEDEHGIGRADLKFPGDYAGPVEGFTGEKPAVMYLMPNGRRGHVCSPPHTFTEEEDGTLTISPSILARQADHGFEWHGYLEHGVWREV